MAQISTNVSAAKPAVAGAISVGALGSTLPTDATTALAEAFASLGYVSEDGLTNTASPETDDVKAWGGDTVLTLITSKDDTFGFTLIEVLNVDVLKTVFGADNVTGTLATGISISVNSTAHDNLCYVIDMVLRGGVLKRIVIPNASISQVGEISYKDNEAIGYAITLNCEPDSAGNTHYEYIVKPA